MKDRISVTVELLKEFEAINAKNERDNVDDDELRLMKRLASAFLEMDDRMLKQALTSGEILEIHHG